MGWGMAKNLRSKISPSSRLIICELVQERRDKFVAETEGSVEVAASPREVAQNAVRLRIVGILILNTDSIKEIIITMLPKGPHVLDTFTNPETGLLTASPENKGKLFIECSTIDVPTSRKVADAVAESGMGDFVDSPVSGGPNGADSGTLTFMVGGSEDLFPLVKTIVSTMGKEQSIFHCGAAGAGLATKQINNYLSSVCILGVSEAMNMGVRYGLDPKVLASVINVSSGKCYNSLDQNPVKGVTPTAAAAKDFEGGFSMELCKGVIDMAVDLQQEVGAKSVLGETVQRMFQKGVEKEKTRGKDCRSIYKLFAEDDGRDLE